jgi:DNA (cytosine-5)-methyltransferase 1
VGPRFVFVENSPMLTSRGLGRVLGDLAAMGYDARWGVLGAVDAGAPHKRDRIWIVAHSDLHEHRTNGWKEEEQGGISSEHRPARCAWGIGGTSSDSEILADAKNSEWRSGQFGKQNPSVWPQGHDKSFGGGKDVGNAEVPRLAPCVVGSKQEQSRRAGSGITWWEAEPDVGRVANGVAARVDRLKAIGNGQVPACAALAWRILTTSR